MNTVRKKLVQANPEPCSACPWRLANQGRADDPHGFYEASNLKRLWDGLRTGEAPGMTCHPTDPAMADFAGYEGAAARPRTAECMGSLVLLSREAKLFEAHAIAIVAEEEASGVKARRGEAYRRYRRERGRSRNGMTLEGLGAFIMRIAMRLPGQLPIPPLPIFDEAIGHKPLPAAPALDALRAA